MKAERMRLFLWLILLIPVVLSLLPAGCADEEALEDTAVSVAADSAAEMVEAGDEQENEHDAGTEMLTLPQLAAIELNGEPLRVVATTSIVGDVVAQVGGDTIELTTLMGPGQDPHSNETGAQGLTAVAAAHVIFINGWGLEEGLVQVLERIGEGVPLVPISANIAPLTFGEGEDEDDHNGANPHVWFSIRNVQQWVENVEQVLGDLDPANAGIYEKNAAAYLVELEALAAYTESQLAGIPEENRFLVTNHDAFGYFAHEYDFAILGTVIPGLSTLAEPSAGDLAGLIAEMEAHGICTIFTETTVSNTMANTVTAELSDCAAVQVLPLYTGAIGPAGSGADSYIGMFRANVDTIVRGLK